MRRALGAAALLGMLACGSDRSADPPPGPAPGPARVLTCTADAECLACGTDGCGCAPGRGTCPQTTDACYADPCRLSRPACRNGTCVLEIERAAAPAAQELDREVGTTQP